MFMQPLPEASFSRIEATENSISGNTARVRDSESQYDSQSKPRISSSVSIIDAIMDVLSHYRELKLTTNSMFDYMYHCRISSPEAGIIWRITEYLFSLVSHHKLQ